MCETIQLKSNNLMLKTGTLEDYKKVYEYDFSKLNNIWQDIEYIKNSNEKIENLFNELNNQEKIYNWIIYYNDEPVGHIVADRENEKIENSIELSYNLHPNYWGKGIMKDSIELVCNYLFNFYDNIVISYCTGNEKSKKLLDKLNFKYLNTNKNAYKKDDKYVDEFVYVEGKKTL